MDHQHEMIHNGEIAKRSKAADSYSAYRGFESHSRFQVQVSGDGPRDMRSRNMREMHRQCRLRHESGILDTVWIPAEFAVKGRPLRLKTEGGWEDGWVVEEAFTGDLPSRVVQERERGFKSHRKATDV
jgi:hypothetical protein